MTRWSVVARSTTRRIDYAMISVRCRALSRARCTSRLPAGAALIRRSRSRTGPQGGDPTKPRQSIARLSSRHRRDNTWISHERHVPGRAHPADTAHAVSHESRRAVSHRSRLTPPSAGHAEQRGPRATRARTRRVRPLSSRRLSCCNRCAYSYYVQLYRTPAV